MTLDMLALGGQIRSMSGALRDELTALPARIDRARALLAEEAAEWEYWRDVVEEQSSTAAWLTAQPLERYDAVYDLPSCPGAYVVAASDGSQLDIDHHGVAACYVINIGTAVLQYGPESCFRAQSQPTLGYRDEDLVIHDPQSDRYYPKEGSVLAAQRDVDEGLRLAALATELPDDRPRLALQDGTLIRWSFADLDPALRRILLGDYLGYLGMMQALDCPVGSYLSRPRSREVIGLVKLVQAKGDFSRWRSEYPERRDDPYRGLVDSMVFAQLGEGQRSARWGSMSRINVEFYGPHRIQFFYLRVGRELARVEFPAWVAEEGHLDLLHSVVYDQCRRGLGYPNVLARAHEQAVIHGDERRQITALIERLLIQAQVTPERSAKATSKLRPGA